jgi:hypothetical protein
VAIVTRVTTGIISGFRSMQEYIGPAIDTVAGAISDLKRTWNELTGSTESATGAAASSTESWRSVGETIGEVIGGIVTFIALVIAGLIKVIDAVLWVVTGIKDIFVAVGTWIGESLAKVVLFFTEDLPAGLDYAWDRVTSFFTGISDFFSGISAWFGGIFSSIAEGIRSFAAKITGFFDGIRQGVKRALAGVVEMAMGLLRKIPDILLPESLVRLKHQPTSIGASPVTPKPAATSEASSLKMPSAMPAVAEGRRRSEELSGLTDSIAALAASRSKREGEQQMTFRLEVDGETIAQASHNASRDVANRAFSPIPVY